MKKICILVTGSVLFCIIFSACNVQPGSNMIKSQRRFAKYVEPQNNNVIDLSEGQKLNYDTNFGPPALNFDIQIVNPY